MVMKKILTKEKKTKGRVYTPHFIVKNILDLSNYYGNNILNKHVIDNSCGDGAFLTEIVDRYCSTALSFGFSLIQLKSQLEEFIHGIEIDPEEHRKCLSNLSASCSKYGVTDVAWDVICADTLKTDKYFGKMDFVLGNPPYVRVHNLEDSYDDVKRFSFSQEGMTDLYIIFYEIGIKMLSPNGTLGYITPSSFFSSVAGKYMRKFLTQELLLDKVVDLKHFQAFNATTYTTIIILKNGRDSSAVDYYQFDSKSLLPYYVDTLYPENFYLANNYYFATIKQLALLKKILYNLGSCSIEVKNGYATLCDDVFINQFSFSSKHIIPVIKASRGEIHQMIYPYDERGYLLSEETIKQDPVIYEYFLQNKSRLLKRSFESKLPNGWMSFGRSQAISDTYKDKLAINNLLRNKADIKILNAPAGTGVYSGFYLIGEEKDLLKAQETLCSDEFTEYISLLGKYKSGGYYTFSSKDIKAYLDYKLSYDGGFLYDDK